MFEFSARRNRVRTSVFLGVGAVFAGAAVATGISDNVPGILLAYSAALCLVLAVAHPWRSSTQFRRLIVVSIVGFVVLTALHIPLENLAFEAEGTGDEILGVLGASFFLTATMLCPAGLVVGVVGSVVTRIRERRAQPGAMAPPRPV